MYQSNRYEDDLLIGIRKYDNIVEYKFLGRYFIDRDDENIINLKYVKQGLDKIYPNKNDSGLLCFDIENKLYQNLKTSDPTSKTFLESRDELVKLLKYVKRERPNLKISLYGIPLSFNDSFQMGYNNFDKMEPLIDEMDLLSPAIYIKQNNDENNLLAIENYLQGNLTLFLSYGKMADKPLLPYIWYMIHRVNKKEGGQLLEPKIMNLYLDCLLNFKIGNNGVDGIIWWESSYELILDGDSMPIVNFIKNDALSLTLKPFY